MTASPWESTAWALGIAFTLVALILSDSAIGCLATFTLAAAWCRRLDAEEQTLQLVNPEALNL